MFVYLAEPYLLDIVYAFNAPTSTALRSGYLLHFHHFTLIYSCLIQYVHACLPPEDRYKRP